MVQVGGAAVSDGVRQQVEGPWTRFASYAFTPEVCDRPKMRGNLVPLGPAMDIHYKFAISLDAEGTSFTHWEFATNREQVELGIA